MVFYAAQAHTHTHKHTRIGNIWARRNRKRQPTLFKRHNVTEIIVHFRCEKPRWTVHMLVKKATWNAKYDCKTAKLSQNMVLMAFYNDICGCVYSQTGLITLKWAIETPQRFTLCFSPKLNWKKKWIFGHFEKGRSLWAWSTVWFWWEF